MRQSITRFVVATTLFAAMAASATAWETWPRHYPPYNPYDPRPDLLPRWIYYDWVPYRAAYNRPTYVGGLTAHLIEPSSQEAMSWEENVQNGRYKTHCPTPVKAYWYPKPWEVLETGARPNTREPEALFDGATIELPPADLTPDNPSPAVQRF